MKKLLLSALCVGLSCAPSSDWDPSADRPPNFVIVLADDQGWGDLSVHGNTNLSTPNIDSLARDGALFDRFFVCPVCSPTRAEFLTARYYPRGGVYGTSAGSERLDLDEATIAETFKAAGYATGAFGKWHNGGQHPYHPNSRGFDEYYGFTSGHWAHYFDAPMDHNGALVRGKGFIIDDLTERAMAFIERNKDRPFFAYLPYNTPHSPMQVPDRFYEKFDGPELAMHNREPEKERIGHIRAALAMVENIDWNVGRIFEKLDSLDISENTVFIYFSDNGPNGVRWNGDMKGRKGSIDEGGVRVPFLIRWPDGIEAGLRVDEIAGAIDLLPTLADIAGIDLIGRKPLDGKSVKPLLDGSAGDWPDREIFSFRPGKGASSVRTQRFRMDTEGQLFDIAADPGQRTDVADQHPEEAARLKKALDAMTAEILAELGEDDRGFPVGYEAFTLLPARDGVAEGTVIRSNRFPNASFFLEWGSVDDLISWDIDVLEAGEYEATVYYACPQADLGSIVELSFGEARVSAKVTEAHDPPVIGPDHDRVERQESVTKDFRPMTIGKIQLAQGRGQLTLRAKDIPGEQAMEVHSITLRR